MFNTSASVSNAGASMLKCMQHHNHLIMVILQCKYVDKYSWLDVVEEEEFRSSPD